MTRRVPIFATIVVAAAIATMIALGIWQFGRAEWKADLIARYGQAQSMSSEVPWPRSETDLEQSLFRWSGFTCERVLEMRSGAGTSARGEKGWRHVARCAVDGGGEAEVALGWSQGPQAPQWPGGEVRGIIAPGGVLQAAQPVEGLAPLAPPDPSDLPNNHLAYAGQWFFFALTALVIYVLALRRRRSSPSPR
ncbi:SURF1 family protein [Altererythrobacter soli]|uniref:SURF1-like protein n=1 Tax=Croceibacterium soli TaxID=1739690 RepID=A0A6I4UUP1_9SPHN|nr:SURF1 family cytochrome oxidase biogenesis protein [Croceibacterium soli]MXP41469.1 SURF1 family protein [Croceibacterium soli]